MAQPAFKMTDQDRGERRIRTQLRVLKGLEITAGIHGTGETGKDERGQDVTVKQHEPEPGSKAKPIDMPMLAAVHEYGTDTIPERSFIRSGVDQGNAQLTKAYNIGVDRILDGTGDAQGAASLIGVVMVGQIRKRIFDGIAPELAASTKKQRDKSKTTGKRLKSGNTSQSGYTPLIDTGQLQGSIAYQVDKRRAR